MSHRMLPVVLCAAMCGLAATVARAASGTTDKLQVRLVDAKNCENYRVRLVVQDVDGTEIPPDTAKPTQDCRWRFTIPRLFNTNNTHFSLRVDGVARTSCRKAVWNQEKHEAHIDFNLFTPARQVSITPIPDSSWMKLQYMREVRTDEGDVLCTETSWLPRRAEDKWTIRDVALTDEIVRLPYFEGPKDACGMILNSIRKLKKFKGEEAHIEVTRPGLIDTLAAQRSGPTPCSAPTFSSAAIDISDKNLRDRGLSSLNLTVK
jgi:hypothetical protein